jgi:nicotinate-nucleotide adenylyltransferase
MRVGVLGGTFDPPHVGHIAAAEACLSELHLDEVLFLPANQNPLKEGEPTSPARTRMEMVKLAIEGHERFSISDIEVTRGARSYAVDTLTELHMVQPAEYWFILGADTLRLLPQWKAPERLLKMCRIALVSRPPYRDSEVVARLGAPFKAAIDVVHMDPVDITATRIRERVRDGHDISTAVAPAVLTYIRANRLYEN